MSDATLAIVILIGAIATYERAAVSRLAIKQLKEANHEALHPTLSRPA